MCRIILVVLVMFSCQLLYAQQINSQAIVNDNSIASDNIYKIRRQFLEQVLHNPTEKNGTDDDNDLAKFNRWFYFMEPRCYPLGKLPAPGVLMREYGKAKQPGAAKRTSSSSPAWKSLGPSVIPSDLTGALPWVSVGRINCVVVDPLDSNTLYAGAACGGVWISHNAGATWATHTDNFPSLSISDIAVNPKHTDTLYAATGDNSGYQRLYNATIFWGGLYSAGVMMSADGGNTWNTTGFSAPQSAREIIQQLLIHPTKTGILLAATSLGIYRTADAGITWTLVDPGFYTSMALHPMQPDTIYAMNQYALRVSYDAGLTWHTLNSLVYGGWIATSAASPKSLWIINADDSMLVSHDEGYTLDTLVAPLPEKIYWYCHSLSVCQTDSNTIAVCGLTAGKTTDGGMSWTWIDPTSAQTHGDQHSVIFNPGNPATMYLGNDGGVYKTYDGGVNWSNMSNGLTISQMYKIGSSRQDSNTLLAGLQDNGVLAKTGTVWHSLNVGGGDGMTCRIYPRNDSFQAVTSQFGCCLYSSNDKGNTFTYPSFTFPTFGSLTGAMEYGINSPDTFYYGMMAMWASYDRGSTFTAITADSAFAPDGVVSMAIAPSATNVIYANNYSKILRTTDYGATWVDVTGVLPTDSAAITSIAVDYKNPMRVYITLSGYAAGSKAFVSTVGGTTWTNISYNLPNIPANCIAADSTRPGALFIGTDMGVYYIDSTKTTWAPYGTGLPNVVVDDIDVNFAFSKIRVATYGRGAWECSLKTPNLTGIATIQATSATIQLSPNPAKDYWKVLFLKPHTGNYSIRLTDALGRVLKEQENSPIVDAAKLASGVYAIEIMAGEEHVLLKAVKE